MRPILIAEDDPGIARLMALTLKEAGWPCVVAEDGRKAADLIEKQDFELAVLDIMLPGVNGYELLEYLKTLDVPALFVTAKTEIADRVRGLRLGAEDYLVKPFDPEELCARVERILVRHGAGLKKLEAFGVTIDIGARRVSRNGEEIDLTPREYDLLVMLMRARGKVLYRAYLYWHLWGEEENEDNSRPLDTHVQRLRRKLGWKNEIRTLYGTGYRLECEAEEKR